MRDSELVNQEEGYVYTNLWKIFETSNPQSYEKTLGGEPENSKWSSLKRKESLNYFVAYLLKNEKLKSTHLTTDI